MAINICLGMCTHMSGQADPKDSSWSSAQWHDTDEHTLQSQHQTRLGWCWCWSPLSFTFFTRRNRNPGANVWRVGREYSSKTLSEIIKDNLWTPGHPFAYINLVVICGNSFFCVCFSLSSRCGWVLWWVWILEEVCEWHVWVTYLDCDQVPR